MRNGLGVILAAGLVIAASQSPARGADDKAAFKDDKEKLSYAVGEYSGTMIKRGNMEVDIDVVVAALRDMVAGKEMRLTDQQVLDTLRGHQMETRRKLLEKNKQEGAAFLAANKNKPGVKTFTVALSETNQVEMQYRVITEGTGAIPGSNDLATVKYRGTLINGKEFDSSEKRGQPLKCRVTGGVIRGWTEALQRMKTGSKWELFIPPVLAYDDRGYPPNIEGGTTLIFEVELASIEPAPTPQPLPSAQQPLTSDIIKVPSAEELKKGAKIEVIKPEDAARMAEEAKKKQAEPEKK